MSRFIRKSLEPFLVGIEPIASTFIQNQLTVFFAHLYPDNGKPLERDKIAKDLQYLKKKCYVLSLPEALNRLAYGKKLPRRAVAIIVDDATRSFDKSGRELISDSGLPYTLAVIPGLIKSNEKEHLLSRLMRIAGHPYWLPNQEMLDRVMHWFGEKDSSDKTTFEMVFSRASELDKAGLLELLDHVQALDHDFMSWEDLKRVQSQDDVNFASHTMSHPQLRYVTGSWLDWELRRSKELLEMNLGVNVESLVVPYGHPKHLTQEVTKALKESGYEQLFFTEKGIVGPDTMGYLMPRMPLEDQSWRVRVHSCPAVCSILYSGRKWRE